LVGKPEGKRPLRRPRCKWEGNIKISEKQVWMVWTGFIWLRIGASGGRALVNTIMNLQVP
jgi:hypothetical protein